MFGSLLLDKKIVASLTAMGFEEPSPIQEQTIPLVLEIINKKLSELPAGPVNVSSHFSPDGHSNSMVF